MYIPTTVPVHSFTNTSKNFRDSMMPYVLLLLQLLLNALYSDDDESNEVNQVLQPMPGKDGMVYDWLHLVII